MCVRGSELSRASAWKPAQWTERRAGTGERPSNRSVCGVGHNCVPNTPQPARYFSNHETPTFSLHRSLTTTLSAVANISFTANVWPLEMHTRGLRPQHHTPTPTTALPPESSTHSRRQTATHPTHPAWVHRFGLTLVSPAIGSAHVRAWFTPDTHMSGPDPQRRPPTPHPPLYHSHDQLLHLKLHKTSSPPSHRFILGAQQCLCLPFLQTFQPDQFGNPIGRTRSGNPRAAPSLARERSDNRRPQFRTVRHPLFSD